MYKLYAYPDTYAIGAHLLLEESGTEYAVVEPSTDSSITYANFALTPVLLWPECFSTALSDYPALQSLLNALAGREAFKRIMQWHQSPDQEKNK